MQEDCKTHTATIFTTVQTAIHHLSPGHGRLRRARPMVWVCWLNKQQKLSASGGVTSPIPTQCCSVFDDAFESPGWS